MKIVILFAFLLLAAVRISTAGDILNENELFPDTEMVTTTLSVSSATAQSQEQKSIGFSGEITSVLADVISRSAAQDSFYSYTVGNIFLDARMRQGLKAFANLEATYLSQSKATDVALREIFFDFNFAHRVYVRTGKQVLQWGRCYFWNPTDLINIERKSFSGKIGYREGAYGIKMHIPFGAKMNIYGFFDTGNAPAANKSGGALKFEFLSGKTEMAFSGWLKGAYNPVFGYDISTRIRNFDVVGELSIATGDNRSIIKEEQGRLSLYRKDHTVTPQASFGLTRRYRLGNFSERISITGEMYYNHNGYKENLFLDNNIYQYDSPIVSEDTAGVAQTKNSGTKKEFIQGHNLYEKHNYSKYYGALFTAINRFIITDGILNINYIRNLTDKSGILSTGFTYRNLNDFSAGLLVNYYLGHKNREYTFNGEKYGLQLNFGVAF